MKDVKSAAISLPSFEGQSVTVAYWFGAEPQSLLSVVDFSGGKEQTVKAPWRQSAAGFSVDEEIRRATSTAITRCR
jgi:hypothetical protein